MGLFALNGGRACTAASITADRALLARIPTAYPRIVIIPSAAVIDDHLSCTDRTIRYFQELAPHASIECLPIMNHRSANEHTLASRLAIASVVYLLDGDPGYLVQTLRGSESLAALGAVALRGGAIIGAGAGAMALGHEMFDRGEIVPALGLIPSLTIVTGDKHMPAPDFVRDREVLVIPEGTTCLGEMTPGEDVPVTAWEWSGRHPAWRLHGGNPVALPPLLYDPVSALSERVLQY